MKTLLLLLVWLVDIDGDNGNNGLMFALRYTVNALLIVNAVITPAN